MTGRADTDTKFGWKVGKVNTLTYSGFCSDFKGEDPHTCKKKDVHFFLSNVDMWDIL